MKLIDIGEVSEKAGIPASTLRYYDEIGLISSAGRSGLRRQFLPEVLLQLTLISMGKSAGFSLNDIARMFGQNGKPELPRPELHKRADELDQQIRKLTALRDTIRHTAECSAPSHMECPTFQRIVTLASRKQQKNAKRPTRKKQTFDL
jgi:DNA-binding transcriptional MerR regulator